MTPPFDGELPILDAEVPAASDQPVMAPAMLGHPRPAVVTLPDEIDVTNSGQVYDTLVRALCPRTLVLIADAAETTFCDCAGLHALVRAQHQATAIGVQLRVVASPAMRRVLRLTNVDSVLDTYPTLPAALATRQDHQLRPT